MSLKEYTRKRDFRITAEPKAKAGRKGEHRFVIQKHAATRLHYDFRLEINGTLKSWACPKGLPYARGEKHLAVHVEDHPVAYAEFEGVIPQGQYGGGTVMVWDSGTFEPLTPLKGLGKGKLHFILHGSKLRGEWYLVQLRHEDDQWLIIKGGDSQKPVSKKADDTSALSGKTMKQLAKGDRVWESKKRATGHGKTKAAPLPAFATPMMAKLVAKAPAGDWSYEIKFDGWRALALKGGPQSRLLSRNEKDFGGKFPEILEAVAKLTVQDAILDGEIVALDEKGRSSFQLLQAYDIGEEHPPLFYYLFDLLQLDGRDLREEPIEARKALLEKLIKKRPSVIRYSASLGDDAESLLAQARDLGLEGLIGKKAGSKYETGRRSGSWVKLKLHHEQEFVIGGYTEPEGSRLHFGSLIIGVYHAKKLMFVGKVGTGFDAKLLRSLHAQMKKLSSSKCPFANLPMARSGKWGQGITKSEMAHCHWVRPELVCQVKFGEWTRDGRLRQPVFLGLRKDKSAREVVREKEK